MAGLYVLVRGRFRPDPHAALFQFEVPAGSFTPGLYTCQINIIDTVSGKFEFPRMLFVVR